LIQGLIIEGLSTAGKTSVFSALKILHSQTPNVEKTMIAITEHYSQVFNSFHGVLKSLEQVEHIQLLKRHVDYLEQLHKWIESLGHMKQSNGVFFILERFHLNHRAAYANHTDIAMLEKRLSKLNALCVLLTISPDFVESRFVESRGMDWKSFVMQNSSSTDEVCLRFLQDQEKLRKCAKQSFLPMLEINTDDADWDSYAKQIMEKLC
jgi:hypothetical protein